MYSAKIGLDGKGGSKTLNSDFLGQASISDLTNYRHSPRYVEPAAPSSQRQSGERLFRIVANQMPIVAFDHDNARSR